MHALRLARRPASGLFALAVTVAFLGVGHLPAASGQVAKPAKKDSRAATQPSQATFTTKVTPAEARPGETVKLSVTAKIEPGWHIYGYNKTQPDDGPRVTQFDLFETSGLKVEGDWTPGKPAVRKKDPAFPDLPFVEYHDEDVTWTISLVIPRETVPGKKSLKVQVGYQLCSEATCSFPGQWTLDAAEFAVIGKSSRSRPRASLDRAAASLLSVALIQDTPKPAAAPAGPKPAEPDSSKRTMPKGVTLTPGVGPAEAKAGDTVTYKVTAKLTKPGLHIYKYVKVDPDNGPKLTVFDFFDTAGLAPKGEWTPSRDPIKKPDPAFPKVPFLEFYEDEVSWSLTLEVPPGTEPGKKTLRCQAGYMVCDDKNCSFPGQWTLPDVELTILPGGAAASATAVTPTAKPAPEIAAAPTPSPEKAVEPAKPDNTPKSDVERQAERGLIPFMLTCAAGGLIALVMPCVWPMIPITVNFFVKQGQKKQGSTTGLAVAYCVAIIGVFTAVGVLFSIFFGAASLSALANNPWVNFAVAGLFLAFGLSLLGLFEVRLPNFLLNASAQGEGKGGMVGVMFMALTLTITSFTCTFPVVGGLLVIAARGSYLYPVIGLATFASVLALPFFVLALSPGLMAKVPKSGDWMNTVKVVGGLIEIGAAFKFLNTAEVSFVVPRDAYFNAFAVLTIWIILALVCGIYLLGLFRTDHDQEAVKVGPGRIVLGSFFLFFALFLTPALFGRPPQSRLWYFVVGLLPADAGDLKAPVSGGPAVAEGDGEQEATSTDPKVATREQRSFHGVGWGWSFEAAVEEAKAKGKPILIDFTGVNCPNCRLMEAEVLPRPEVVKMLKQFVTIQLYTDRVPIKSLTPGQRQALAEANLDRLLKVASEVTNPLYVVLSPDEVLLGVKGGKASPEEFTAFLKEGLDKLKGSPKVAQAR